MHVKKGWRIQAHKGLKTEKKLEKGQQTNDLQAYGTMIMVEKRNPTQPAEPNR